jgi:hypothetical protein
VGSSARDPSLIGHLSVMCCMIYNSKSEHSFMLWDVHIWREELKPQPDRWLATKQDNAVNIYLFIQLGIRFSRHPAQACIDLRTLFQSS